MKVLRTISVIVVLAAALLVTVAALTATASRSASLGVNTYETAASAVLRDFEANSSTTENVYQQQVVAAWAAKDFLAVSVQQNAEMISIQSAALDNQANVIGLLKAAIALGFLALLTLTIIALTRGRHPEPATTTLPPPATPVPPVVPET